MDSFLNSPNFEKLSKFVETVKEWHMKNGSVWRPNVERLFQDASGGKIRAFQHFYDSPDQALKGYCQAQTLRLEDMKAMYPQWLKLSQIIGNKSYVYIFTCNDGLSNGRALTIQTVLKFDDIVAPEDKVPKS